MDGGGLPGSVRRARSWWSCRSRRSIARGGTRTSLRASESRGSAPRWGSRWRTRRDYSGRPMRTRIRGSRWPIACAWRASMWDLRSIAFESGASPTMPTRTWMTRGTLVMLGFTLTNAGRSAAVAQADAASGAGQMTSPRVEARRGGSYPPPATAPLANAPATLPAVLATRSGCLTT
jgi:hypothetical protein